MRFETAKIREKLLLAFLLKIIFFLSSCAPEPIIVENIDGYKEIGEGDDTRLEWSFRNADRVRVEGVAGTFSPKDYFVVKPTESIKYNIIAYHGKDSLIQTIRVKVKSSGEIKRGPDIISAKALYKSITEGEFLSGILAADSSKGPVRLKIIRTIYPNDSDSLIKFRALLLDQFGNFITGYSKAESGIKWNLINDCQYSWEEKPAYSVESDNTVKNNADIGVLLDVSEVASENRKVFSSIKECLSHLTSNDNFCFSVYNQNYAPLINLSPVDKAAWEIDKLTLPDSKGLCAVNKAVYKTLEMLNSGTSSNKALVVISYYSDNASVTIEANDVEEYAKKSNIPVYIIGIGDALSTYQFKYITSATGGRFYHISPEQIKYIDDILREISLSQKLNYEIAFKNEFADKNCTKSFCKLSVSNNESKLSDDYSYIVRPARQFSLSQVVSVFNYRDTSVTDDYSQVLKSVTTILGDNPTSTVELTGNSSSEDFDESNVLLSMKRADAIKSRLLALGASPSQVKTKGIGFRKPLFYFEQFPWQGLFNRRVEIRWLDPLAMPYEIITEQFPSEMEAENNLIVWEKRNFKVYFDRVVEGENIVYRTKLWGFSTQEAAETTAKELSKKYKKHCYVE